MLMDEKNMGKKLLRKRTELRREMEMFVIDRKFLLQEWQALPPAQKGVLAPGPLPSELSKSLSFFHDSLLLDVIIFNF